jgi:hypothetical protein
VDPITVILLGAAGAGVRGIIWLIDRERDRRALLQVADKHPDKITDFGKAIERTRRPRWQLPRSNRTDPPKADS